MTYLFRISRRVQSNSELGLVEDIAIEMEKVQQQLAEVGYFIRTRIQLQKAGDQADDRETTQPTCRIVIQATDHQEMLDHRHQDRESWMLNLPRLKCGNRLETRRVVDANVHPKPSFGIFEFDNRDLRGVDNKDAVGNGGARLEQRVLH